jgi:hypothetical protein|tara:strand:+ start:4122 stop:4685 length:564 start_codon:yes stop_codon:yes gene_type:complete
MSNSKTNTIASHIQSTLENCIAVTSESHRRAFEIFEENITNLVWDAMNMPMPKTPASERPEMSAMTLRDAADLQEIRGLLMRSATGTKFDAALHVEAVRKGLALDTCTLELIPQGVGFWESPANTRAVWMRAMDTATADLTTSVLARAILDEDEIQFGVITKQLDCIKMAAKGGHAESQRIAEQVDC